ncbi:hypothetical protein Trydic_g19623 [Trypoxylus dichotomus]
MALQGRRRHPSGLKTFYARARQACIREKEANILSPELLPEMIKVINTNKVVLAERRVEVRDIIEVGNFPNECRRSISHEYLDKRKPSWQLRLLGVERTKIRITSS